MKIISKVYLLNIILLINIKLCLNLKQENSRETENNINEYLKQENDETNPDDIYGKE
jgi:hypothetical protein